MATVAFWPSSTETVFLNRADPGRLRSAGICIFTGGGAAENGIPFVWSICRLGPFRWKRDSWKSADFQESPI